MNASQRIRVFHLCDKFGIRGARTHGVSRLFSWWMPRFAPSFDVRLIGLRPEDDASAYLRRRGLDPICLGRGPHSPAVVTDLLRLVRRERPHILHAHGFATSNFARIVRRLTGTRVIVQEHAAFPSIPAYQRMADLMLAAQTDLGIAVSESTKAFMVQYRHLPADRIQVVHNGAPLDEFRPPPAESILAERARLQLRAGVPVVGTVGRLDAQKGVTFFLKAAAIVLGSRPEVQFVIAGDGPLLPELQEEARTLGIAERVVFAGFTEDVPLMQALFDIQVFPSLWEGTPLTVFEAMAMRRPIVSTTADGLGEVLRDRRNALLVSPGDAEGLAAGILELLDQPALARALATRAGTDSADYDVQRTVDRLQVLYQELVTAPA